MIGDQPPGCDVGGSPMEWDAEFCDRYPVVRCGLCGYQFRSDLPAVPHHRPELSQASLILSMDTPDDQSGEAQ